MSIHLSLFAVLLASYIASSHGGSCWSGTYLPLEPSPVANLTSCCWYSKSTCCNNKGLLAVFQKQMFNMIQLGTMATFQDDGAMDCSYALSAAMCALCDPNSFTFVDGNPLLGGRMTFTVCQKTCDTLFNSCGGLIPGNTTGASQNSTAFCKALFSLSDVTDIISTVKVDFEIDDEDCFQIPALTVVSNASCMATYANTGGSSSSTTSNAFTTRPITPGGSTTRASTGGKTTGGTTTTGRAATSTTGGTIGTTAAPTSGAVSTTGVPDRPGQSHTKVIVGVLIGVVAVAGIGGGAWYYFKKRNTEVGDWQLFKGPREEADDDDEEESGGAIIN